MSAFEVCVRGSGAVGHGRGAGLVAPGPGGGLDGPPPGAGAASDVRTYALNAASIALLTTLKVWDSLPADARTPVYEMCVEGDRPGSAVDFSAWASGVDQLSLDRRRGRARGGTGRRRALCAAHQPRGRRRRRGPAGAGRGQAPRRRARDWAWPCRCNPTASAPGGPAGGRPPARRAGPPVVPFARRAGPAALRPARGRPLLRAGVVAARRARPGRDCRPATPPPSRPSWRPPPAAPPAACA
jgi:hypothetical protein